MEHDDNMHDADSCDSSDDENEGYDELLDIATVDIDEKEDRRMKYTVLSLKDISECQRDAITSVSNVLSLSEAEATILLRHSDWSVDNVYDQWFADEEKVRNAVGLLLHHDYVQHHGTTQEEELVITCPICLHDCNIRDMKALKYCGHLFCKDCWAGYIHTSIYNDGSGCLNLRCPNTDPRCRAVVSEDMVFSLGLPAEDNDKYRSYLVRSYVEQNSKVKWCPAPKCENAVELHVVVDGNATLEVVCKCSYAFCWNCLQEPHRPLDCDTVRNWVAIINDGESQNLYWILCNSKRCPKCEQPIEKNSGCMHMTCRPPCGYQFCWICLSQWDGHGTAPCNRYRPQERPDIENGQSLPEDVMKMTAEMSSDRFLFYLERWKANEKSQEKAVSDLKRVQAVDLEKMSLSRVLTMSQTALTGFKCVEDACQQIVECRRMLKWTYAYGHYLPSLYEHDAPGRVKQKQDFFEFLQREAENSLERLHQLAEDELQKHIDLVHKAEAGIETSHDYNLSTSLNTVFDDLCRKLEGLTNATAPYFGNLIQAFENGLSEVDVALTGSLIKMGCPK